MNPDGQELKRLVDALSVAYEELQTELKLKNDLTARLAQSNKDQRKMERDHEKKRAKLKADHDQKRAKLKADHKAQLKRKQEKVEIALNSAKKDRDYYKREYKAIKQSRTWRYTEPARKLLAGLNRIKNKTDDKSDQKISKSNPNKTKTEKNSTNPKQNSSSLNLDQGVQDNPKQDEQPEQPERHQQVENIHSQLTEPVEKPEINIKEQISRVIRHKYRLYKLGFIENGLSELQELYDQYDDITLKSLAAWELALWQANHNNEERAHKVLELLQSVQEKKRDYEHIRELSVLKAECLQKTNDIRAAKRVIFNGLATHSHADLFLAVANLESSHMARIIWMNQALEYYDLSEVSLNRTANRPVFDRLVSEVPKQKIAAELVGSTQVSVIISTYNVEHVIHVALDAILAQTWSNLDILVVDDCSTDGTVAIVEAYVERDARIQLLKLESNGGPYVARNQALKTATGEFVTVIDAEDWSHPQKIEKQVLNLLQNSSTIGNISQHVYADEDLTFYRRDHSATYMHKNLSSLMFRRKTVLDAIGYWDCVRFGADREFIERLHKVFGSEAVVELPTGPLSIQRRSQISLTGKNAYAYYGGYELGARKEYAESYQSFHDQADNLRYECDQRSRSFPVPEPMYPVREINHAEQRHLDVIIVSDFRLPGGTTTSNVEEIKAQKQMGLRTGLVQMSRYDLRPERTINPKIREWIDGDQVQMLVYGEKLSCDLLIVKHPPILQNWQEYIPEIQAKKVCVIVNQTPQKGYGLDGEFVYDLGTCVHNCQKYFGKDALWYPIGPSVRETLYKYHAEELQLLTLADEDWSEIIDVNEWRRPSRPSRGTKVKIGRHSRSHDLKWPPEQEELLAIYPDTGDYEVHVLGGAEAPEKVLGRRPSNWYVLEFGEVHPQEFLATLDVFVYYTHPDLVEAFGRVIFEAMAVGVPVIIPPKYRPLFGEAAIYAQPSEVLAKVDQLMSDDHFYESQVQMATRYVEQHFGYCKHAERMKLN